MRGVAHQSFAFGRTTTQPGHVGLGGRLVDEDQPRRVEPTLAAPPSPPRLGDILAVLLGRMERLFLYVSPILVKTQWIAATVHFSSRRCLISASVRSGSLATNALSCSPCSGISFALRPQYP